MIRKFSATPIGTITAYQLTILRDVGALIDGQQRQGQQPGDAVHAHSVFAGGRRVDFGELTILESMGLLERTSLFGDWFKLTAQGREAVQS